MDEDMTHKRKKNFCCEDSNRVPQNVDDFRLILGDHIVKLNEARLLNQGLTLK